jgi:hypothetical protein
MLITRVDKSNNTFLAWTLAGLKLTAGKYFRKIDLMMEE